jgi:predicted ATPase/DNA-binding SARP family transcriptional activator
LAACHHRLVEVRLLGPVEVADGDRIVAIAARKQRALLSALALQAGSVVPLEALVDRLWEEPPPSAPHAVQVYVSALRSGLPDGERLRQRAPGYVLDIPPDSVDALRFESLVREGMRSLAARDLEGAVARLRAALELWRGPALADATEGSLRLDAERLEERRIEAYEACLGVEVQLGRFDTVLDEAERLLTEHPLREQLVRLVMLARYRAGRQVDSLDAFRRYRRQLADELGLVPSAELRELEAAILRHEVAPAAPSPASVLESRAAPGGRLIGRVRELSEIASLLRQTQGTFVTLAGPGGIGKTSLALAVADELGRAYSGGAIIVRLAEIDDPALVMPTVAALVGAPPSDENPVDGIVKRLASAPALVVLDNAEHLPAAAPTIAKLAEQSRGSAFLVTSRTPLHVAAERVVRIAPLDVPATDATPADSLEAPAVALLVERARERGVDIGTPHAASLASIARRLDGVPLAIELAAARIELLGVEGLLSRLDRALDVLATDRRDAPARQRTLRAVVEWSERLLGERERELLATLAVFAGGASIAAIEQVSGDPEAELLDALGALVDHGLVRQENGDRAAQEPRFALPEPIRAFAAERLTASGREDALRERHASWMATLSGDAAMGLVGCDQDKWLHVLDNELPNVRAVARWAEERRPELVVQIVVDLYQYWFARGLLREARGLLEAPLAASEALDAGVWARAAARAAWFDTELGSLDDAERLAEAAAEVFRRQGDGAWLQRALGALATVSSAHGEWDEAARLNREILELARAGDEPRDLAYALMNTASDAERADDWTAVRDLLEEALALLVRLEDERGVALAETNLAACRLMDGDTEVAAALAERALERVQRLDLRVVMPYAMAVLAHTKLAHDAPRAAALALDAARLAAEQGLHEALCTAGLARACALAAEGNGEGALDAFTAVEAFARMSSIALPPWFRNRAEHVVRECVDPTRWETACDAARSLTPSEAEAVLRT